MSSLQSGIRLPPRRGLLRRTRRRSRVPRQLSGTVRAHRHTLLSFNVSRKSKSISNPFCLYPPQSENWEIRETRSFSFHRGAVHRVPTIREAEGYKDGQTQPFPPRSESRSSLRTFTCKPTVPEVLFCGQQGDDPLQESKREIGLREEAAECVSAVCGPRSQPAAVRGPRPACEGLCDWPRTVASLTTLTSFTCKMG